MKHFSIRQLGWALGLAFGAGLTAPAAHAEALPATIGCVDINKLLDEFEDYKQKNEGYKLFVRQRLEWRNQRVYLTAEEWEELDKLQALDATKLTDAQKLRIEELTALSKTRDKELVDLRGVREPTPEQEARRKYLTDLAKGNSAKIKDLNELFDKDVKEKEQELLTELKERIRVAVEAVAKEKGLVMVLEKAFLLYNVESLDITPDVLTRLNQPAA